MYIEDALRRYIESAAKRVARSTHIGCRNDIDGILIPVFGGHKLTELRASHVQEWIDSHELTTKRTCNILTPLRAVMEQAVRDEKIDRDPLRDFHVEKRQIDKQRKLERDDVDPFSQEEIKTILPHLHPQVQNYVQFAVWTGLRVEQLIEIKWTDVDEKKGEITIRRARTRGEVKEPKTAAGKRAVKLLPPALAALRAQKEHTYVKQGHIFHDPRTNAPWATDKPLREWHWRKALRQAKVRYRPPMQTRHTYASWMLGAGEPLLWTSKQMGHESAKMTLDVYAAWLPDSDPLVGSRAVATWDTAATKDAAVTA